MIRLSGLTVAAFACGIGQLHAQSDACPLLAEMLRADGELVLFVSGQGGSDGPAIVARALDRVRSTASTPATAGELSTDLVIAFVTAREAVLVTAVHLGPGAAAGRMAGADVRQTAAQARAAAVRLSCPFIGSSEVAPVPVAGRPAAPVAGTPSQTGPRRLPPMIPARPDLWLLISVFLSAFAVVFTLLERARRKRRRRQERFPCALDVAVHSGEARAPARIVDLSRGGAKLRLSEPPPPGTSLALHWHGVTLEGRVAWSTAHFAGLHFRPPLESREMQMLLAGEKARASAGTDVAA